MAMITMEIIIRAQTPDTLTHTITPQELVLVCGVHLIYDSSNIHSVHWNYYWRPELVARCMFA